MDLLPVPIDSVTIQPVSTTKNGQCLNKVKRTLERVSFGLVMKYCKDRSKLFDNYFSPKSICLVFLYNKNKNTAGIKEITAKIIKATMFGSKSMCSINMLTKMALTM